MAGAEELLTSAELVAVSHGDELLAQEVLRVNTFIAHARSVQELANLIINLGLSDETSHEIINAFRERTEGMEFDPVVELGRTINNIAAILPPKIDQTDQAALPVASQAAIPIETTEPKQVEAKTPKTRTTPKAKAHTPKETPEVKEGIGRLQTALEYLESLTGQKYEAFDISKASELADVIMEFAAIEVRKNSPNHKAIIVGALETTPNTELARSLNLTTAAIRQQKIYVTKKVLENPRRDELGPIIEKILLGIEVPVLETLDQTSSTLLDVNDLESEAPEIESDQQEKDTSNKLNKSAYDYLAQMFGKFDEDLLTTADAERLVDLLMELRGPIQNFSGKAFQYRKALVYRFQNRSNSEIAALLGISNANVLTSLTNFKKYILAGYSRLELERRFMAKFGGSKHSDEATENLASTPELVAQSLTIGESKYSSSAGQEEAESIVGTTPSPAPPTVKLSYATPPTSNTVESKINLSRIEEIAQALAKGSAQLNADETERLQRHINPGNKHGIVKVDEDTLAVVDKIRKLLLTQKNVSLKDSELFDMTESEVLIQLLGAYEYAGNVTFVYPKTMRHIAHTPGAPNLDETLSSAGLTALEKVAKLLAA